MLFRNLILVTALALICRTLSAFQSAGMDTRYTISGIVLETGTSEPIADVEVGLVADEGGAVLTGGRFAKQPAYATRTDAAGRFVFTLREPAAFHLRLQKDGYVAPGSIEKVFSSLGVAVSATHVREELEVRLSRKNSLMGKVIDRDSNLALTGMRISLYTAGFRQGHRAVFPTDYRAVTTANGVFTIDDVPPGDYYVEVRPVKGEGERFEFGPAKQNAAEDVGYVRTLWPGGESYSSAQPVTLDFGAALNLGDLRLVRENRYRLQVSLQAWGCEPGAETVISLYQMSDGTHQIWAERKVPCGSTFTLVGLRRTQYDLVAWTASPTEKRQFTHTSIDIVKDASLTLDLHPGLTVVGRVRYEGTASDGSEAAARKVPMGLRVRTKPIRGLNFPSEGSSPVDEQGAFQIENARAEDQELWLQGLENGLYVSRILYRGSPVQDGIVRFDPYALDQTLTIVLGTRPGAIDGTVLSSDRPVRDARVLLLPFPYHSTNVHIGLRAAITDSEGRYHFLGLPPGDYRAVAVLGTTFGSIERPQVLEGLLPRAKEIHLDEGSQTRMQLEPAQP